MKKVLALLFLLFIPFMVNAEVKIKEAVLVDSTKDLEVEPNPHHEGLELDIDMKLAEVGEYAKYKLTIENDTKKDYEIDMGEAFSDKEYIKYEFSFVNDDNAILKSKESKDIYVTVTYNKEVPENEFVNGVYNDDNVMTINLSNEEAEEQVNPSTTAGIIIFGAAIILVISVAVILFSKHKIDKAMMLIIATAIIIPMTIFALEKITITIKAKIQIVYYQPKFCVGIHDYQTDTIGNYQYYNYANGSTWEQYINSSFNNNYFKNDFGERVLQYENDYGFCAGLLAYNGNDVKPSDKIIDSKTGCYYIYIPIC